jgi:putative hydrolase of the HAD superfamily
VTHATSTKVAATSAPDPDMHGVESALVAHSTLLDTRGLILDLDDTLYPREDYVQSGLMAAARHLEGHFGIPALESFAVMSAARREGRAGVELQAACGRYALPSSMIPLLVDVIRGHRPVLRLPDTTGAVLRQLKADGWRLVVLTNGLPSMQRLKVDALGLAALVDGTVYADEHATGGKPSPMVFQEALRRLETSVERAVMVGDDPTCDIEGARAVGLKTVRLAGPPRTVTLEADAVIDSLASLPGAAAALLEAVNVHAA